MVRWIATLLTGFVLLASGCMTVDRRSEVAYAMLVDKSGEISKVAYEAALTARFPPGTKVAELVSFVEESGGVCREKDNVRWCEIPYLGGFCWGRWIDINFAEDKGVIGSLRVVVGGLGC